MGRRFVPQSTIDRRVQNLDDRYARQLRARFPAKFLAPEIVPFVDVEIVPAPDASGPIVDVVLIPSDRRDRPDASAALDLHAADPGTLTTRGSLTSSSPKRSRVERLATLDQIQAVPHADAKRYTKLERAIASKAARLLDKRKLDAWAKAVKDRDEWKDRRTGVQVRRTRQLDPLRAEAHHIEPKSTLATRYDVRNGVCLSYEQHYAVETNQLRIEGTRWFRIGGQRFIDATFPIHFVKL